MSRTYKKYPECYLRHPKGHIQALRCKQDNQGVPFRNKSVPPSSWDDLGACRIAWLPYHAVDSMVDLGMDKSTIAQKIVIKFHISYRQANEIIEEATWEPPE